MDGHDRSEARLTGSQRRPESGCPSLLTPLTHSACVGGTSGALRAGTCWTTDLSAAHPRGTHMLKIVARVADQLLSSVVPETGVSASADGCPPDCWTYCNSAHVLVRCCYTPTCATSCHGINFC